MPSSSLLFPFGPSLELPCPDDILAPYFLAYKTEFFSFQNNPKNLDPSYKNCLELFRKDKTRITAKLHRTDLIICTHSREGNTPSNSRINTVYYYHTMVFLCTESFKITVSFTWFDETSILKDPKRRVQVKVAFVYKSINWPYSYI